MSATILRQTNSNHNALESKKFLNPAIPNNQLGDEITTVIHRITLTRPPDPDIGLGFSIRGGIEHGLGHFVSTVEPGSEAHLQGLRPGDQLLKVDSMSLNRATHREVVNLINSKPYHINLEVKSVGVIPIKIRKGDPVSWKPIETELLDTAVIRIPQERPSEHLESRIGISLKNNEGLGCSICKGPISKPGIFVQSTKPGSLARESGLRPGDQILDCNGVSFQSLEFNEAVKLLKANRSLDLLIRKGAGADLFPSESSGYDSSSSSNNGNKRILNALIEENEDELSDGLGKNVSENRIKLEEKLIEEERRKLEEEQERLKREAIKLEHERKKLEEEKKMLKMNGSHGIQKEHNHNLENRTSQNGLAGAIQNELQRRALKKQAPKAPVDVSKAKANGQRKTPHLTLKNDKHDALMAEFKKAHKKMFNSSSTDDDDDDDESMSDVATESTNSAPESSLKSESINETVTLPKPTKAPPPPPPERVSSISPTSSDKTYEEKMRKSEEREFHNDVKIEEKGIKIDVKKTNSEETMNFSKSPGIPTPDYYDSSPDKSPESGRKSTPQEPQQRKPFRKNPQHSKSKEHHHHNRQHQLSQLRHASSMSSLMTSSEKTTSFDLMSSTSSTSNSNCSLVSRNMSHSQLYFSKRHREVEDAASLESFTINDFKSVPKPPPFYFDRKSSDEEDRNKTDFSFHPKGSVSQSRASPGGKNKLDSIIGKADSKSVRFNFGSEGMLASHDYRYKFN